MLQVAGIWGWQDLGFWTEGLEFRTVNYRDQGFGTFALRVLMVDGLGFLITQRIPKIQRDYHIGF